MDIYIYNLDFVGIEFLFLFLYILAMTKSLWTGNIYIFKKCKHMQKHGK